MFVRKKTIRGRTYYYLVKSVRKGKMVRQRVLAYLGNIKPFRLELGKIKKKVDG